MSAKTSTWWRKPNAMAFEHRAVHVGAAVAEVHAGEHAAQVGVVQRALLAEEVGQAQYFGRAAGPPPPSSRSVEGGAADEGLEPADQAAAGGHAAVGQPVAGYGMGVEVQPFVDDRGVAGDQDVARATEFDERVAGLVDARREGGEHVVGAADHQAVPALSPVASAAAALSLADQGARTVNGWQRRGIESPAACSTVSAVSPSMVNRPDSSAQFCSTCDGGAQRAQHPVVGAEPVRRAGVDVGFVCRATTPSSVPRTAGSGPNRSCRPGRRPSRAAASSRTSACALASFWRMAWRNGFPRSSTGTTAGTIPDTAMAADGLAGDIAGAEHFRGWTRRRWCATGRYRPRRSPARASAARSRARPGRRCRGRVSNSTVLVPVVPTSMPMVCVLTATRLAAVGIRRPATQIDLDAGVARGDQRRVFGLAVGDDHVDRRQRGDADERDAAELALVGGHDHPVGALARGPLHPALAPGDSRRCRARRRCPRRPSRTCRSCSWRSVSSVAGPIRLSSPGRNWPPVSTTVVSVSSISSSAASTLGVTTVRPSRAALQRLRDREGGAAGVEDQGLAGPISSATTSAMWRFSSAASATRVANDGSESLPFRAIAPPTTRRTHAEGLQRLDVAPDRHLGHVELGGELGVTDLAVDAHALLDAVSAGLRVHPQTPNCVENSQI